MRAGDRSRCSCNVRESGRLSGRLVARHRAWRSGDAPELAARDIPVDRHLNRLAPFDYLIDADRARSGSLALLLSNAEAMGVNGVVGLRFDASDLQDGSTRVLGYGEAVFLEADSEVAVQRR